VPLPVWLVAISAGVALLTCDRLTKAIVASRLRAGAERRVVPGVRVRYVRHRLKPGVVERQRVGLMLLLGAASLTLIWLTTGSPLFQAPAAGAGIGMALAGAGSNLWDRLRHYAFVDFVCIGAWPAFNLADVGVCLGAVLALLNVT